MSWAFYLLVDWSISYSVSFLSPASVPVIAMMAYHSRLSLKGIISPDQAAILILTTQISAPFPSPQDDQLADWQDNKPELR